MAGLYFLIFASAVLLTNGLPQTVTKRYDNHRLIQVEPKTNEQFTMLKRLEAEGLDFWKGPAVNKTVTFRVAPEEYRFIKSRLTSMGLPIRVIMDNIQKLLDTEAKEISDASKRIQVSATTSVVGSFARHGDINNWLTNVANSYSSIASISDIGTTYEGRIQRVIKIGSAARAGVTKPAIWLDAGIHAREWITPATMTYIIDRLLTEYTTDVTVKALVDKFDWYILPVANPDGYEYTFTGERLWRKTRSPTPYAWCKGADPNRNFDFHFGEKGVDSYPCSNIYPGARAFSEKCTSNMANFITARKAELKLYLSLHSYSQLWLTPWGYTTTAPSNNAELLRVANIGKEALRAVNGRSFEVGSPANILYEASGGSYDWAKGKAGIFYSYTLELYPGRGKSNGFVVSQSQILPSGKETWAGIKATAGAIR